MEWIGSRRIADPSGTAWESHGSRMETIEQVAVCYGLSQVCVPPGMLHRWRRRRHSVRRVRYRGADVDLTLGSR
jgi:hypothetical protein